MPIVRPAVNGRELVMAGWGLVPFWMKPEQMGKQAYSTINARDGPHPDGSHLSRALQKAALPGARERLVRVAEDRRQDEEAPPLPAGATPFAFAGVWDTWKGDGKTRSRRVLDRDHLTSTQHGPYHDRMPVVLEESQFEDWMRGPPELAAR